MSKVSVTTSMLCPSKEVFKTLQPCLTSIRSAVDAVDGEWFLVDDGSPFFSEFFVDIADVYIRNNKTQGVSTSMNRGMKLSSGDFFVKLDSDYLVPPTLFKILLRDWEDGLGFIAPAYAPSKPGINSYNISDIPAAEGGKHDGISGINNISKYNWGGGILMFDAAVIADVGYFDEGFGVGSAQDNDMIYRVISKGYNWRWSNNVMTRHFVSVSSIDPNAPDSRADRRRIGREYFIKKHGFKPGGFIHMGRKKHADSKK